MMQYAGFTWRFIAFLIDMIVVWLVGTCFGLVLMRSFDAPDLASASSAVFAWVYYASMESLPTQGTLGKLFVRIKVTDFAGERIGFIRASVRHFGKILSGFIFGIGFFIIAFTKYKQGLHDMLAGCLVVSADGARQKEERARRVEQLQASADLGDAQALYELAIAHETADGVVTNQNEAVRLYQAAAAGGHVDAMYELGMCLRDGKGVEGDPSHARLWFEKAAALGDEAAQHRLDELTESQ